ncbi:MAG: tetratricopeptide repeat protein [Drouetiella hepatica Uher 2000/2452]|jgi:tetratricopeptide (TPR) repeat protein|uniref:Tetratricopeptide repeat protein n=1 Tax=Drouetiella hepatica Uher 2000/2452 TaxID=904376 RepID=A0A951UKZ0_9CYAN|nr:tetratricopeptide repeat protein [Drouetiella hepatica Uher 2000/2452]
MNQNWRRLTGSATGLAIVKLVIMGLAIVGSATPAPAQVSEGYTLLNRGWVNDAIAAFRQTLQSQPQSLEAKLGLAIAYQRAGQDANAWQAYQQVLAQDPRNRQALTAVGQLGGYRPEWQPRGITALTTLLDITPGDTAARTQRALLYGYQGEFSEAIADYQILLTRPTPEVVLGAAQIYAYSGDYLESLTLFDRYLATGKAIPNSAVTAYALSLQETGSPDRAIQVLQPRLQTSPDDVQIRATLASAYAGNYQIEQALTLLDPLRDRPETLLPLARALSSIGRQAQDADLYKGAIDLYRQVLQQTPNPSTSLITEIADVFSDDPSAQPEALPLYEKVTAQQPQNQSAWVKQWVLQQQLGQISKPELQQQLQQVLGTLPTRSGDRRSLALALLRLDPPQPEFLPLFQSALQEGSAVPFFNFRIAQIALQQGDREAASKALTLYGATPIGTKDPATDFLFAEIERQQGNLDASAQRYQKLVDRNLGDPVTRDALRGLAGIQLAQGKPEAALSIYDRLVTENPQDLPSQLGQAGVAYQLQKTSKAEAEAVLEGLNDRAEPPSELFLLVGALPADPQREKLYERLLAIDPNNIGVNLRWVQLWASRDPAKAQAHVTQLLVTNPDRMGATFIQGDLAQRLGNLPLASQAYEDILTMQPDNPDALSALGGVRFQQKRFAEAERLYTQVLSLRADTDVQRILAELKLAQDQPIAALARFQALQKTDSRWSDRAEQIRVNLLRRRGFQPYWERY